MSLPASIPQSEIKRICVIRLGRLGDVFLTTSYFETLKKHMPNIHITFMVKAGNHRILRDHPFIDELFIVPKAKGWQSAVERVKTFKRLAAQKFDLVIDHQYQPSTMLLSLISGAKYRIGLDGNKRCLPGAYTHKVADDHLERVYAATKRFNVLAPLGIAVEPYRMHLAITEKEQKKMDDWIADVVPSNKKIIVLSPGSTSDFKCWSREGFAQVADHFSQKGFVPIIIWGPSEEPIVEAVMDLMQEDATMAIPTTPQEAVALLKRASLFITNDGGINHLAVAAEVNTVTPFAGSQPLCWTPDTEFNTHKHLHNTNAIAGDDFWGITTQEVIATAESLLAG